MENRGFKNKFKKVSYYLASALMPSILLFDLFNRNHGRNYMLFSHVLIITGILAVAGFLLFVVLERITKSMEGALLLSLLCWLSFWTYESILGFVRGLIPVLFLPSRVFALLLLIIVGLVAFIFRKKSPPFEKIEPAFNILAVCLIVMFLFNFTPGMNQQIALARVRAEIPQLEYDERPFQMKQEFYVNPNLPNPDIYWFHVDGLMSMEMIERFWGLDYSHLREELHRRGFLIYGNAELNAGFTTSAMPALLSPAFYDSFWGEQLNHADTLLTDDRVNHLFRQAILSIGFEGFDYLASYFELFGAFFAGGYKLIIYTYYEYLPTSFEHLLGEPRYLGGRWQHFTRTYLPGLLSMATPLPYFPHEPVGYDVALIRHLENIEPVANFTWFEIMDGHMGSVKHRVVEHTEVPGSLRYDLYPALGFEYVFWRVMNEIDGIIARNPNAVIVLQSDHGFHLDSTQYHLLEQGYTMEQVLELTHSVFSAVRIPDEYGGLEEPVAPLNITRVLVNRFVGENYELLY